MATSTAADSPAAIVPAQVGFLAIFNPGLGDSDETLDDQIVYYSSVDTQTQKRKRHRKARPTENVSQEERNERLRQIGLAQGMVSFSKDFSDDQAVDSIETEKTRVVLHELEPGWWILASIDLTRLPLPPPTSSKKQGGAAASADDKYEHSSREVKPAALLLQDMLKAHSVFLLHHDSSLSSLFMRIKRTRFTTTLARYWDLFLSTWDVLLHGNPVRNIFGGIKVAASGELGIGVGEEERGSGEREVLEGFVERTEGLVDITVSKFGDDKPEESSKSWERPKQGQPTCAQWLGTGNEPGAEDGAVFLGVGRLSRKSVGDITHWVEDIYTWGEDAYGVLDSPKATRQPRGEPRASEERSRKAAPEERPMQPPPSLIGPKRASKPAAATPPPQQRDRPAGSKSSLEPGSGEADSGGLEKYMDYLKLGYGKYWSIGGDSESKDETKDSPTSPTRLSVKGDDSVGHFLIGLTGEVEEGWVDDPEDRRFGEHAWDENTNPRTVLRTVTVELETDVSEKSEVQMSKVFGSHDTELNSSNATTGSAFDSQDRNKTHKLRVVVYVIRPFIFTFLFELRTGSLAFEGLYRSLHHQIAPLRKSLGNSTAYRPEKPDAGSASAAIYDLVWDPREKTVHSTIPNIPEAAELYSSGGPPPWSRVEALNTHMQILNLYKTTRADLSELERTCKTSRGWWVVWSRILERKPEAARGSVDSDRASSGDSGSKHEETGESTSEEATHSSSQTSTVRAAPSMSVSKEIILIRKASDHSGHGRSVSLTGVGGGVGWADGASRLAQGIGVDTRKYIEGLLSMNR